MSYELDYDVAVVKRKEIEPITSLVTNETKTRIPLVN